MRYLVKERLLAIGDDYWIKDEDGDRVFHVDGKALRLRDTFVLKDAEGNEVAVIRKKMISVRDRMRIERDGETLATVHKKLIKVFRDRYVVDLAHGGQLDVRGNFIDREYTVKRDGDTLAEVSRKFFRLRDTYGIEITREDADRGLLIAVCVCVDQLAAQ
ncbi:LURP-one-related/scramblase family protein [Streptomyces sp. NPDC060194]|uniref:LURP-one-related/scramblase family protein n=1 Tax=Streptomyces sp. NPDC060194 TaxID=3347069 RepID=UPI00364FD4AE